jgi:error-prone DNA polymerase
LLNAQPLGFYAPAQLISEAKRSGVNILPVDINHSDWDNQLTKMTDYHAHHHVGAKNAKKPRHALRLGLRLVKGLARGEGERIAASRDPVFATMDEVMQRADVSVRSIQAIAAADGFTSLGLARRQALWQARRLGRQRHHELPLFAATQLQGDQSQQATTTIGKEPQVILPVASPGHEVAEDYRSLGLSLKAHPLDMLATPLAAAGWQLCHVIAKHCDGERLRLAGLVTMRQRPGTAGGTVFLTIEDGQGQANVIIWPKLTVTYRQALLRSQVIGLVGRVQKAQSVTHFIAESLFNLNGFLHHLDDDAMKTGGSVSMKSRDFK